MTTKRLRRSRAWPTTALAWAALGPGLWLHAQAQTQTASTIYTVGPPGGGMVAHEVQGALTASTPMARWLKVTNATLTSSTGGPVTIQSGASTVPLTILSVQSTQLGLLPNSYAVQGGWRIDVHDVPTNTTLAMTGGTADISIATIDIAADHSARLWGQVNAQLDSGATYAYSGWLFTGQGQVTEDRTQNEPTWRTSVNGLSLTQGGFDALTSALGMLPDGAGATLLAGANVNLGSVALCVSGPLHAIIGAGGCHGAAVIPEPTPGALMGLGLAALGLVGRRRSQQP